MIFCYFDQSALAGEKNVEILHVGSIPLIDTVCYSLAVFLVSYKGLDDQNLTKKYDLLKAADV